MATKAPLAALYAQDEQQQKLVDEITSAYSNLRSALDSRQQLFDPTLLAAAQGFLAPTKSGGFGESLGNVAAAVGPVQEQERRRSMEEAQMRLELAQSELGMRQAGTRLKSREDAIREYLGGKPMSAGAPGAAPAPGAPAMQGAAPTGQPGAAGVQAPQGTRIAPPDQNRMTGRQYVAMTLKADPTVSITDLLKKAQDIDAKNVEVKESGVINHVTGMFYPFWKGEQVERQINGKTYKVPVNTAMLLDEAQYSGNQEAYDKIAQRVLQGPPRTMQTAAAPGAAPAAAPVAGAPVERPPTKSLEQIKTEEEEALVRAREGAKGSVERTQAAINAGGDFAAKMGTYQNLEKIASDKDATEIFGIFNRPDVASAILTLIEGTTNAGGTTISLSNLQNALRNVGLKQETINKYQLALSQMANVQLQFSRLAQGQGAISNFERSLFADAAISPMDNPATIIAKVQMLRERAKLDNELAQNLLSSKLSLDDFKVQKADKYNAMTKNYLSKLDQIVNRLSGVGNTLTPQQRKLRTELGM